MLSRFTAAFLVCVVPASPALAGDLRVGAATAVITPPPGTPMAGYYHARAADGVHDDLQARTIVIEKDGVFAAIVSLDLISTTRELTLATRREIEKVTGIPGRNVMIGATHAHTGPVLGSTSFRYEALGGEMSLAAKYTAGLPARIADSVRAARDKLAPARAATAIGRVDRLAFNRRFHMKDGSVGWNPGKGNPAIVRPAGPTDAEVPIVYVDDLAGKPITTYVNFAMHLDTVGGTQISADYPYTLARLLGAVKGPEMVTVFGLGTCGDINHIDVGSKTPQKGHGEAARIGTLLAGAVLRGFEGLQPASGGALRTRSEIVRLALPRVGVSDVAAARKIIARVEARSKPEPVFMEQVGAFKVVEVAERKGRPQEVEVQVIALGDDIAWVSLPGEIFVELGLAIKRGSPFATTAINELANGSIGYIPTRAAWPQGNYEVVSARCAEGSGEILVDTALRLLRELHKAGR